MESLDENQLGDKIKLVVPYKESYIKTPFNVWKFSFIGYLVLGAITGLIMLYAEFIMMPSYSASDADWDSYYNSYRTMATFAQMSLVLGVVAFILSIIFALILLFRNWKVIGSAKDLSAASAGQAVGFLFIPIFSVYWIFIAHWKLSEGQEKFISQSGITTSNSPKKGVALAYCICTLVPYLGQAAAWLVLGPIKEVNQKNVSLDIIRASNG
ncbi:MAG: hypothetical protein HOK65_01620 [Crocinitomicaceae bacterium]|jgi:hypothetical protein|nr:hypothetical protein [Crocinitomicaceae bacterium]